MMHYYQFNIGNYARRTRHLCNIGDLAYRRLLDLYYLNESPMKNDFKKIARLIGLRKNIEIIEEVLNDFFVLENGLWINKKADEEIAIFHSKADRARANGKLGGRPKKARPNPDLTQSKPRITQSVNLANLKEPNPKLTKNQEPRTNNHKPLKDKTLSSKPDQALEIFQYWCEVMKKQMTTTKLTTKRLKAIKARLKDYSPAVIKMAIYNCSIDPFSMGKNDRKKPFNDIELICRSGEKLESFLNQAVQISSKQYSDVTAQNIETFKEWINE